jgi:AcrR family transcriptional regulator
MKTEVLQPPLEVHPKPLRSDGAEARCRLLDAALHLFAEQGFSKTSIREIALAAQTNVAAISYYFGDKLGLYREVFVDPRTNPNTDTALFNQPSMSLSDSLRGMLMGFTEPLKLGEVSQSCMKLQFREMLEPTGMWRTEIDNNIKPAHHALVEVLCRHLQLDVADDDIHRLAFSISGLGVMLHVGGDVFRAIRPELLASPHDIDAYTDRLVGYALAMVASENQRRSAIPPVPTQP